MYGLLVLNFIIPLVMTTVGSVLKKHPVTDMKKHSGYNTPTSRKSQEHWDYAQRIAPDIFLSLGKILGIAVLILSVGIVLLQRSVYTALCAGIGIGVAFLVYGFYKTETEIKKKFER